jgi:tRNA(Phe) wybutosine-synthesizing methylase Tyw3
MVTKPGKFIVEFQGTEAMSFPVRDKGQTLVEKEFMQYLLKTANKKLKKNKDSIKKFEKNFLKIIK